MPVTDETMNNERYMERCLQLAALGAGQAAPNPMVGAVLAHGDRIIGEGFHRQYGQAHAEVNCLASVSAEDRHLLTQATLYVSLEPCVHHGKTPPCADLIIRSGIPEVVIGCIDTFAQVAGKGVDKLKAAGIKVSVGMLEDECRQLNRRFFTFHEKKRPYLILKWAQTQEGWMACADSMPLRISNSYTDRLVHRWRSEETAILIGVNTLVADDPLLTNRYWTGSSPLRIVTDRYLRAPADARMLHDGSPVWIFNTRKNDCKGPVEWIRLPDDDNFFGHVMTVLHERNILSVLVEGGRQILQHLLDMGLWDEARVITGTMSIPDGIAAPRMTMNTTDHFELHGDRLSFYYRKAE